MVDRADVLERLRAICLALPETSERPSHGATTTTATAASRSGAPRRPATRSSSSAPIRLGVRLDRGIDWQELAGIVEDAFCAIAPKRLVDSLGE